MPAFLTAWLFAFSLLSNCYCMPTVAEHSTQDSVQPKMPAHCQQHSGASKNKSSDCAPRFNTDQFENQTIAVKAPAPQTAILNFIENPAYIPAEINVSFYRGVSPPISPPSREYYLLHHSFLI